MARTSKYNTEQKANKAKEWSIAIYAGVIIGISPRKPLITGVSLT